MGGRVASTVAMIAFVLSTSCGSSSSSGPVAQGDAAPEIEAAPNGCQPGELLADDGHCEPAGIPLSMCGKGFEPDGHRGCNAILPADPCPLGTMATPGETACHDVAPCADGTWGDIPVEANTQFVDRSFTGTSDGSAKAPWKKIQDGIKAAASGAIVAVAAGSYAEDVLIGGLGFGSGKPVRLWGKCTAQVEIVGSVSANAALLVGKGAAGTELHGFALRGAAMGLIVSGSTGVLVDRVWIHDAAGRGVDVEKTYGKTGVTLTRSLVERNHEYGIIVAASEATIEATVVRDTQARSDKVGGDGIVAQDYAGTRANLILRASLVERNREVGVVVGGSDAAIETTVVRDTQPRASDQRGGRGIDIQDEAGRSTLSLTTSLVERNLAVGVRVAGSDATIEATVVRDTQPQMSDQAFGRGIEVQVDPSNGFASTATLRASLVESSYEVGVLIVSSSIVATGLVVRDTKARLGDGLIGDGLSIASERGPASAEISATRIEHSVRAGLSSFGADVKLGSTALECNTIHLDGEPIGGVDHSFTDRGSNVCGCSGASVVCQVLSSNLTPPTPIPAK